MRFARLPEEAYIDVTDMVERPSSSTVPLGKTKPPVRVESDSEDVDDESDTEENNFLQQQIAAVG